MPRKFVTPFVVLTSAWLVMVMCAFGLAQQPKPPKKVRRAQPPKVEDKSGAFFNDAFTEALVGERPANLGKPAAPMVAAGGGNSAGNAAAGGGVAGSGWAGIISSQTIEDEIKNVKKRIDADITTPAEFAGKGYQSARRDFSMAAMLLAIVGEYDGEVRWKKDAPAARDVFARTAANAKVGTTQVFNEAKLRQQELQDMIEGSSPFTGKEAEAKAKWAEVVHRAPLMQYLEEAYEPQLKPMLNDKAAFTSNLEKLQHEAEVFAAISSVLTKEGMEDADADEYKAFAARMEKAARDIVDAVKQKNYDAAAAAGSVIGKSCVECHESYRSN